MCLRAASQAWSREWSIGKFRVDLHRGVGLIYTSLVAFIVSLETGKREVLQKEQP